MAMEPPDAGCAIEFAMGVWFWFNSGQNGKPGGQSGVLVVGIKAASFKPKAVATGNQ
jgi:hypothetical protein